MAANLAKAQLDVTIWNRTPSKPQVQHAQESGCRLAENLQTSVLESDIIFVCVPDVPDVESILFSPGGVAENAKPGALIIDMSTIGPNAAQSIAARLQSRNLRFLDAPMTGGDIGALNGTLTIMAGGTSKDFEEALPSLQVLGKVIKHCGPVGAGQALKLVNQILVAINMVALAEGLTLAKSHNVDPNSVVDICGTGAAGSWALSNLGPRIIKEDYEPGFMIQHIRKDLRLIKQSLPTNNLLPGLNLADRLFELAANSFSREEGSTKGTQAMIQAYKDNAQGSIQIK